MKYELGLVIETDDKTNSATFYIDGYIDGEEECHYIFTDTKTAKTLYNDIVVKIYKAGTSEKSGAYELTKGVNDVEKALKTGTECGINSMDIRKGKFVSELDKFCNDQSYSFRGGYIRQPDDISNPSHYTKGRKYEPRKVIEDWNLDWNLGNAVKYISRAGRKDDPVKDLKKAMQYLDWAIEDFECKDKE